MTGAGPVGPPASRTGRILGVDAARAVALVGMFATHILPLRAGGAETPAGLVADGRASALFAVLAGVGVALSTGGPVPPARGRAHLAAAAGLIVRGVLVGLLGLVLAGLDPPVAVILAYYGVLFVVATPLLRLPVPALAAGAVLACVLTPAVSLLLRRGLPAGPGNQPGLAALAEPGALLETLTLTGYYPVLTWTTYLLAGMAVGRLDLRSVRVGWGLLAGGAALALLTAGTSALLLGPGGGAAALGPAALQQQRYGTTPTDTWWWLAVDIPHSGASLDLAHTTGTALAVLGAMLLLARWARPLVLVPAAVGAVPLTLYTLHVVALTVYPGTTPDGGAGEGTLWLGHVLAAVAIGSALWLCGRRGPLESVVSGATRRVRRLLDPAPPASAPAR
ncbi:heparan-alpha-glucosaminide N-acetyltransferase domain-containing protein [Pseudonocardia xinjiangensis]|uniref:heparan-alpha-glucosaminide N-acetyltransferase domain-containing protein n=1 Tax=Pseudonocardia xinjiangensis TaxID=75289 RepID=UPI003D909BDD